ncbi:LSU ribosomal protein L32p [hydrothermal vent metagenome]|uniref:LSU ribosomal protein L32p n=1 Tax=hydrothermal vent metagenome TaxID=652676 RepID=A0A3B0QXY0_9ZZZZ
MAHPKKRQSKSRRNKRRSHDALSAPATSTCPQCSEVKRPHNVCMKCGTYKGREIIKETEDF